MELRRAPALPDADCHRAACVLYLTSLTAIDWEHRFIEAMGDFDVTVYTTEPGTEEKTGLEWTIRTLEYVSVIGMWLDPAQPPGDLELEFGLAAATGKLVVGVPPTSSMRSLADIVARRYALPLADDLAGFVHLLRERVDSVVGLEREMSLAPESDCPPRKSLT